MWRWWKKLVLKKIGLMQYNPLLVHRTKWWAGWLFDKPLYKKHEPKTNKQKIW